VKSYRPADPSTGFVVSLLTNNKTSRHEITQFAVHPLRAFSAAEARKQQRFLVSLASQAPLIEDNQPLCLEIGFHAGQGKLHDGTAAIDIELVDLTQ